MRGLSYADLPAFQSSSLVAGDFLRSPFVLDLNSITVYLLLALRLMLRLRVNTNLRSIAHLFWPSHAPNLIAELRKLQSSGQTVAQQQLMKLLSLIDNIFHRTLILSS